jgi:hypothetical protein
MSRSICLFVFALFAASLVAKAKPTDHQWSIGKVLDANRARYFAGMLNNSSSNSTENGSWNGSANSISYGNSTNTNASGNYSGTRSTSTNGYSVPIYRVYDNLVIEGEDTVYITSERLRWRWSKGTHVAVNGTIKYYADGRKLHVLDDDNKEHTIEIIKEIKKVPQAVNTLAPTPPDNHLASTTPINTISTIQASITIDSTPPGADIEIDGAFVGNSPSTLAITLGNHQIAVKRKGFSNWGRTITVTGGSVHLNAELEQN